MPTDAKLDGADLTYIHNQPVAHLLYSIGRGFNGSAPGLTIQVTQGDRVRVIFDDQLPEPSSIHWHGFEDQIRYDGQPVISQPAVKPRGRFIYELNIHHADAGDG